MFPASATSFRVLGVSVSLQAAYNADAINAEIERPFTNPFSNAFL